MAKVDQKGRPKTDFKLSYMPKNDVICFMGTKDVMKTGVHVAGSKICNSQTHGDYISIPATRENFMIIEALSNPASVSDTYIKRRGECMNADKDALEAWDLLDVPLIRPLMKHQRDFCARAYPMRAILNASEQGTGKTAMAIAMHSAWGAGINQRGLIVCPKSLIWQWASEYQKVLGSNAPDLVPMSDKKMTIADKIDMFTTMSASSDFDNVTAIINYEILADLEKVIREKWRPDFVVFDESWKIKSPSARVTKSALAITGDMARSGFDRHVLLLSGTPMGNDVGDLWPQINVIESNPYMEDYDEWMANYAQFRPIKTRGNRVINVPIGCKDPVGLMRRISPVYFRATKASCLNLPEKAFDRVYFDMPPSVQELYERVEEMGNTVFDPLSLSGERVTKLRLQQITGGSVPEIKDAVSTLLKCTTIPSPKRDWVVDFANDILLNNADQRCIIWCKFNAEIAVLTETLSKILGDDAVVAVTRHTTDADLQSAKDSFNARKEGVAQVFVAQIKKLAYGHNLQAGDWNILYSHPWSYIDRDQLEDRTHRLGREGIVRYVELVVSGTYKQTNAGTKYVMSIDEEVLETIGRKENLAARLGPDTVGD